MEGVGRLLWGLRSRDSEGEEGAMGIWQQEEGVEEEEIRQRLVLRAFLLKVK